MSYQSSTFYLWNWQIIMYLVWLFSASYIFKYCFVSHLPSRTVAIAHSRMKLVKWLHWYFAGPVWPRRWGCSRSCVMRIWTKRWSSQVRTRVVADGVRAGSDVRVEVRAGVAPVRTGRRKNWTCNERMHFFTL
jgi:hypothetical protein